MTKTRLIMYSALHALGITITALGSSFIGPAIMERSYIITPLIGYAGFAAAVVSAVAIIWGLLFIRPIFLFSNGQKQEALMSFCYTVFWLLVIVLILFGITFLFPQPLIDTVIYN